MGAFILVAKFTFWPSMNPFLVPAIWLMIVLNLLLTPKRYISGLEVHSDKISLTYFTAFLTEKNWSIDLPLVRDVKFDKGFLGELSTLTIITKGKWHSFDIYNKAMVMDLEQKIASANIGFLQQRLDYKG